MTYAGHTRQINIFPSLKKNINALTIIFMLRDEKKNQLFKTSGLRLFLKQYRNTRNRSMILLAALKRAKYDKSGNPAGGGARNIAVLTHVTGGKCFQCGYQVVIGRKA